MRRAAEALLAVLRKPYYEDVVGEAMQELEESLAASPAVAPKVLPPEPSMFDAFGEPRTRYVRVTFEGQNCVMHPSEGDTYLKDARECGDESEYAVADVYLSEREFDDLGEFDGF